MKKLALILMFTSGAVVAQTVTYTNQYGMPIGTAQTNGNMTTYSNQYGQVIGYSQGAPAQTPPPSMGMNLQAIPSPQVLPTIPATPLLPVMPVILGR